ncbi:MAG: 4Fe-4S binding protein [Gammaproteobacteria bacterium]
MYDSIINIINNLVYVPDGGMVHPGLPPGWVLFVMFCMLMMTIYVTWFSPSSTSNKSVSSIQIPLAGSYIKPVVTRPWVLLGLRIISALVFLLVIYAGLFGSQVPERNIATMLTWTIWWSGVVISILFIGSAWCAICPWDAIASWLVKRKLWRRGNELSSLNLRVPKIFRSVWPALFMFVGLTWLELGVGVTVSPYATALMALLMVVLATISLAVFERKAFCRYFCAVGRTIGAYSSMSPVALRPVNENICAECKTLECYYGTKEVEPCPTHLVMGRITQNTYCTSCGACSLSCPYQNVSWQVRGVGDEITFASRPHWDEAWFILGLLALTIFHGFTMMPYWEGWMQQLAYFIGDSGKLLISFSIGMFVSMMIPVSLYLICVRLTKRFSGSNDEFKRIFSSLAFSALPLAFTYHIAHNLTHLFRESQGFWSVVINPLGFDTLPLGMHEIHMRHMNPLVADDIVFALQGLLVMLGFWLAIRIARQRVNQVAGPYRRNDLSIMPVAVFISTISLLNLWLLMQPMVMRM